VITKLIIRNFKRLRDVEIPLDKTVVFIGPNNSGKTTALQALALWDVGVRAWSARLTGKPLPKKRPGIVINRRDLISTPVPSANLLWHGLHVRRTIDGALGRQNIRIDISVSGVTKDKAWTCGMEFDFSNKESFVCRPLRLPGFEDVPVTEAKFSDIPEEASNTRFAFLPPMSGLADREFLKQPGEIGVLIGQGQTAQVLRNLCYRIVLNDRENNRTDWVDVTSQIETLFGAKMFEPIFIPERGEITLEYEENGIRLDISASGRGLQQTLLLLAHLYANPDTALLLDEPDAHLEILRQREIFRVLNEVAEQQRSQIIAASHSEVILNEAADTATVVAFVGKPHLLNMRKAQLIKSLTDIGWDQYYQAQLTGWVLYLEGPTDLEILRAFAVTLAHEQAIKALARPFVHYVATNLPQKARDHFYGLREAKPDLLGIAIYDRLDKPLTDEQTLVEHMWRRREIENYFCTKNVLTAYARHNQPDDLFGRAESEHRSKVMENAIGEVVNALETLDKPDEIPWSKDIKTSDVFLEPVFKKFFAGLKLQVLMSKKDYHKLARLLPPEEIDPEIKQKLDAIVVVAGRAQVQGE
jgi:hypothetical protein